MNIFEILLISMKNELLDQLTELREQLNQLKVIYCRMTHERVLIDRNSNLPIVNALPDGEFQRVGLCSAAVRSANLVCSHTMARYKLENALNILGQRAEYDKWQGELNELTNLIHLLDHEKGDAEKQLARVVGKMREGEQNAGNILHEEQFSSIFERIAEMNQRHDIYGERMERLKTVILSLLNSIIEIEENKIIFQISEEDHKFREI